MGLLNACIPQPQQVVVEEQGTIAGAIKKTARTVDAVATAISIDLNHVGVLIEHHEHDVWSKGSESVIGTMNRTAAAFAVEKTNRIGVEEEDGVVDKEIAGSAADNGGHTAQPAAAKLGAKWKEKVFRYKGESNGVPSDVLNRLLLSNLSAASDAKADVSNSGHPQKLEDLLKDMTNRFGAAMSEIAMQGLEVRRWLCLQCLLCLLHYILE